METADWFRDGLSGQDTGSPRRPVGGGPPGPIGRSLYGKMIDKIMYSN